MKILDWVGSFFVYKSPKPYQGFARFLETLTAKELRALAGTTTHHSKKKLVQIYLKRNNVCDTKIQN
tara:strand:- start:368 stop:568 length:201 start_codon:yes stop_codon:yes gene_type:complete